MDKALICGAGFSLKQLTPEIASNFTTFCINSAIYQLKEWDYAVITDLTYPSTRWKNEINRVEQVIVCNQIDLSDYHPKDNTVHFERKYTGVYQNVIEGDKVIRGTDAVHIAVDIAIKLGFRKIYLLGVDLLYNDGKKYYNQTTSKNDWQVENGVPLHYQWHKDKDTDLHLNNSYHYWENLVEKNKWLRNVIIDCSKGRLRNLFRQKNIYDVLAE